MASRIATTALRASASLTRPQAAATIPRIAMRAMSSKPAPAERANEIIESVPSNNLVTKTGAIVLGTGLTTAAISQELYVVNEETVVLAGFLLLATTIARSIKGPYAEWANGQIAKIRGILNQARQQHTQAVKDRISSVEQMKDVVDLTKGLFAMSKDTAQLEAEIFAKRQQVAMAAELKAVLDSWVRYEQQEKEAEQAQLAKTVIENVMKSLADEKAQRDILLNAVTEVEQLVKKKAI
ncbi:atp4 subunit B of the stator stalk of mitochondrial F1F0 ATP synthase [Serendipita sp. 411]|nr:atp4 subunit B of the stator stalk of mitochondrial F1F0 ATP synthase [Serendipita sp. 398]KAG8823173.1 atp4 subunit B of the stator stalk of mitochondrial F1F0 ATP synthase [Serendipita sp. 401]KAG8833506.1 atp4 subunit B of the stator stalk of mitochondrial F1F0 ATP synthase [Serendipita sp. 400]KAG8853701.1 atp4 subunit B of the stator stalk of mitochondrial F1F0 ATP synthase [Serendipita sp. 411]